MAKTLMAAPPYRSTCSLAWNLALSRKPLLHLLEEPRSALSENIGSVSSTSALIRISRSCALGLPPMSVLATSVATLTAVSWSYLALARRSFWRLKTLKVDASDKAGFSGCIAAIVPARDEAELIGPVATSLLNQRVVMPVLLVDDESTDGTADVARRCRKNRQGRCAYPVMGHCLCPGS